jgi:hypothetical protein
MSRLSDALAILQAMKGAPWELQFDLYSAALERLPEHLIEAAVSRLAGETWRPAPFDIVRQAVKIEMARRAGTGRPLGHPFPTGDEAYAEIVQKIQDFGRNGRVEFPDRPSIRTAGPPPFSHPLVAKTVAMIGGWEAICSGEANYAEGLAKQVKSVYERQAENWVEQGARALCLPEEASRACFPRWQPFEIEFEWREPVRPSLPPLERPKLVPCPDDLRQRLEGMGVHLSPD